MLVYKVRGSIDLSELEVKMGSKWKWVQTGANDFGDGYKGNHIAYAALKASLGGK